MRTVEQARVDLQAALKAKDLRAAQRALRGIPPVRDPTAGLLWTELIWGLPDFPDRVALAQTLIDAFPERGEIVRPCAEILVQEVGPWIPGDPPAHPELARRAAEATQACLQLRPDYDASARSMLLHTRAAALSRDPVAPDPWVEAAWEQALTLAPDSGSAWYGAGLWLKNRGRFQPALASLLRAQDFLGASETLLWNLGICATGAHRPDLALAAWRALGLPVRLAEDTVLLDTPTRRRVRLVTTDPVYGVPEATRRAHEVELVPLGPCDGTLQSAAGPWQAGQRWLHDGVPIGSWADGDAEYPTLAALARLGSSAADPADPSIA